MVSVPSGAYLLVCQWYYLTYWVLIEKNTVKYSGQMTHVIFTAHMHSKVRAINLHKMEAKIWPYFRSTRSNSKKVSRTEVQQKQQKSIFWVSCLTHMEKRRSENIKKPWKTNKKNIANFALFCRTGDCESAPSLHVTLF